MSLFILRTIVKIIRLSVAACALAALAGRSSLSAHHSFASEYDASRPLVLTGAVTNLRWTNPHVHVLLDVVQGEWQGTAWDLELATPNALIRRGWRQSWLAPRENVSARCYPAKDGSNRARLLSLILRDGRTLSAY